MEIFPFIGCAVRLQFDHGTNQKNKIHISAYTKPTQQIYGMLKDAGNTYYCTKNQVRGLCAGGDMDVIFWFVPKTMDHSQTGVLPRTPFIKCKH